MFQQSARLSVRAPASARAVRPLAPIDPDLARLVRAGAEGDTAGDHAEPERELLATERREALHGALGELPDRQRELLRLLLANPDVSYEEVSRQLAMPIGSIGPTRARSLDRLRRTSKLQALQAA